MVGLGLLMPLRERRLVKTEAFFCYCDSFGRLIEVRMVLGEDDGRRLVWTHTRMTSVESRNFVNKATLSIISSEM